MGTCDKPLLTLGGRSILERLIAILSLQCQALAISANGDPHRFFPWSLPVLSDDIEGAGPLAGVLRGLDWAAVQGLDSLLTVPGDTPFIPPMLLQRLLPAPCVAVSENRRHHLVATWPVSCCGLLRQRLEAAIACPDRGALSVKAFADLIDVREIVFDTEWFDPFFNVNTPEDYQAAIEMLEHKVDHDRV